MNGYILCLCLLLFHYVMIQAYQIKNKHKKDDMGYTRVIMPLIAFG